MNKLILAVIFLAACGSSDPTFMGVCEQGDEIYLPVGNAQNSLACEAPTKIKWPSLPIAVGVDPEVAFDYSDSVDAAIDFWNSELDFTAFTRSNLNAKVHVVIGSASDAGDGATSFYRDEAGELNALVELRQPGDTTSVMYIFDHEFGHVLGLCHDPDDFQSAMYPKLEFTWDGVDQDGQPVDFRTILVTDNDQKALTAAYR